VFPDLDALSHAAAAELSALARQAVATRGRFALVLAGGSTPRRLYQLLAEPPYAADVPWERVEFFWGDERPVPPDHPESNYRMAREALLSKVGAWPERIHRIRAEEPDRASAAAEYGCEIARVLGAPADGPPPVFDLILLGLGADGHTASLFPGSAALRERRSWAVRNRGPGRAEDRITLTVPVLNRAREVRVLVAGPDKAMALAAVLEGPRDPERLPAQLLLPGAGRLAWLVDRAAAADLSPGLGRRA
jgi:6-phosphogluconolactonase